jgi:hypothetical protein
VELTLNLLHHPTMQIRFGCHLTNLPAAVVHRFATSALTSASPGTKVATVLVGVRISSRWRLRC